MKFSRIKNKAVIVRIPSDVQHFITGYCSFLGKSEATVVTSEGVMTQLKCDALIAGDPVMSMYWVTPGGEKITHHVAAHDDRWVDHKTLTRWQHMIRTLTRWQRLHNCMRLYIIFGITEDSRWQ